MPVYTAAAPARASRHLGLDDVHVWRLAYRHDQGRTPLRQMLAAYLDVDPADVHFHHGEHGRPALTGHAELDFNWSHSRDIALIAIARSLPQLGIDVEASRPRPRALQLAQRFFAASEHEQLAALPAASQQTAFLRLWTAKEAVLKALGEGLRYGLHRVTFDLGRTAPIARSFSGSAAPVHAWQLHAIQDADCTASLAWRGDARRVYWFRPADSI
ncbi:4'-phosphopantetheinyl transferase superfamily protein [Oleiagrimonas citrea]